MGSIDIRGVEESDFVVECVLDDGDPGFVRPGRAVVRFETHASKTQLGDL